MTRWQKTIVLGAAEVILLLVFYEVILQEAVRRDVVSVIFSAGSHVPPSMLLLAGAFLALRALVVLILPGMILSRLGLALFDALWRPPDERDKRDGMEDQQEPGTR